MGPSSTLCSDADDVREWPRDLVTEAELVLVTGAADGAAGWLLAAPLGRCHCSHPGIFRPLMGCCVCANGVCECLAGQLSMKGLSSEKAVHTFCLGWADR